VPNYDSSGRDAASAILAGGQTTMDIMSQINKEKQSTAILKAQLENQALLTALGAKEKADDRALESRKLDIQEMYYKGLLSKEPKQSNKDPEKDLTDEILWGKKTIDPTTGLTTVTPGILTGDMEQLKSDPNSVWKKFNILSPHISTKYKQYAIDVIKANIGDPIIEEEQAPVVKKPGILDWITSGVRAESKRLNEEVNKQTQQPQNKKVNNLPGLIIK